MTAPAVDLMAALVASLAERPAAPSGPSARELAELERARELDRQLGLGEDEDEGEGGCRRG